MRRDRQLYGREAGIQNPELAFERFGWIDFRRNHIQEVDSESARITAAGSAIPDTHTAVPACDARRVCFAIRRRRGRMPEFRSLRDQGEVDVLDLLRLHEAKTGQQEQRN
jgi:hypothetical protein